MIFYIPLSVVHSVGSGDITDTIVVDGNMIKSPCKYLLYVAQIEFDYQLLSIVHNH